MTHNPQTTVERIAELITHDWRGLHYDLVVKALKVICLDLGIDAYALQPTQAVELIDLYNEVGQ